MMNAFLLGGATGLHLLATVTVIGLYVIMYSAVTPAAIAAPAHGALILDAYRRAKPLVLGGWLTFIVTGVGLMLLNSDYQGLGQFGNRWSILMLAKHVVVLAMILMSGFTNVCPVIGLMRPLEAAVKRDDPAQTEAVLRRLHRRELATMLLGVTVLLMTAAAEMG